MVGKGAVNFAEQFGHLAAQCPKDIGGRGASHAVARVHHDLHRAAELDVAHDVVLVSRQDILMLLRAPGLERPAFRLHGAAQGLNVFAVNGFARQHHFEAVVVRRVVATCDLYAAAA